MATKTDRIICLDLDGTLANSQEAHAQSYNLAFEKNNLHIKSLSAIIEKFGPQAEVIVKRIFPTMTKRKLEQVIIDKRSIFIKQTWRLTKKIPGVLEALQELKKDFKLALISNSTHEEILVILKAVGIDEGLFSVILGHGETHAKPDPDIIDAVEEKVSGVVEYFVGDTIYDIKTGNSAEIKTIAVLTGVHGIKLLGKENPTIIIESVALLPDYFAGEL